MASLRDPVLKLTRAHVHFRALEDEIMEFLRRNGAGFLMQRNGAGTEYLFSYPAVEEADSSWSTKVGDVLFNARAALDHLVYQLHAHSLGTKMTRDQERASMFPIFDDPESFQEHGAWRIQALPAAIQARIEEMQPYKNRALTGREEGLVVLDTLHNIDKHRRLHYAWRASNVVVSPPFLPDLGFRSEPLGAPQRPHEPFLRWTFEKPPASDAVGFHLFAVPRIFVGEASEPIDLMSALSKCLYSVGAVLNDFRDVLPEQ